MISLAKHQTMRIKCNNSEKKIYKNGKDNKKESLHAN